MERKVLNDALRPGPECIDVEQLARFVDAALPDDERRRVAAHVDACLTCQAEVAFLQAFTDTRVSREESAAIDGVVSELRRRPSPIPAARVDEPRAPRSISLGMLRAFLAATAALLVVAGSFFMFRSQAPQFPRDIDAGGGATRSLTVTVRGPIGDVTSVPARLEWQAVAGAVRYRARIMEVDRTEVWSAEVGEPGVELPAAVRARIVPAKTLLWDVTAYGVSNAPIAASEIQRFRLAR